MPRNPDVAPVSSQAALYPNCVQAPVTKPQGSDQLRPYRTPREEVSRKSALEEELDAGSVFDPLLGLSSQSSQPLGSQPNASPDTTMGASGPKTPPHFSETLPTIPPFDLALLRLPAPMSPVMAGENVLLNLAPGSPVQGLAPPRISHGVRVLGHSSCSDSPHVIGIPGTHLKPRISLEGAGPRTDASLA